MGNARHDVDFFQWAQDQAALLRAMPGDSALDVENLAEEVQDMGRDEIREISSLLRQTIAHLLKIAIDPHAPTVGHWFDEVVAFQGDAVLAFSPGLGQRLDLEKIWRVASNGAVRSLQKHGVSVPPLPLTCPLELDDLLDPEFDPDSAVTKLSTAIQAVAAGREGRV